MVMIGVAAPAAAGPIAAVTADVDGDGIVDDIQLTEAGVVVSPSQAHKPVTFALAATRGRITADGSWIAVEVDGADSVEGIGLRYKGGALTAVWRGPIGPQGVDGEWRIDLTATDGTLVKHQSRPDIRRCDGKPALLFPDGWDDKKRAFAPVKLRSDVATDAPSLTATAVTGAAPRPVVFTAVVASTGGGAANASELAAPSELIDGDAKTAWREDRAGDGRGEFITFRATVRGESGRALWFQPDSAAGGNRIKRLAVVGKDRAYTVDIPGGGAAYRVDLPDAIGECVTVVLDQIDDAKKGAGGTTGIAELVVLGDTDLAPGGADAALVAAVIAGGAGAHGAADMLVRRGTPGAQAVMTALAETGLSRDAQIGLLRVLIRGHDPVAAGALATGIATVLTGPDLEDATRSLAAMGPAAATALAGIAADRKQTADARVAALDALAGIAGNDATAALIGVAGDGPRPVRGAITKALGARPLGELLAAAPPAAQAAQADVWRGIGLAALRASDADRGKAVDVLVGALAAATDYEGRYRAIQGVGALGDDAALATLSKALGALAAGTETNALREVAALALARNPAPGATTILIDLAHDGDPGVRLGAIGALAQRTPGSGAAGVDDTIDKVLAGVLASDGWIDLRRAAAGSLGQRCQRAAPAAALERAVTDDAELEVRGDALAGLVACSAAGIADLLVKVAADDKLPLPLRQRAVILTVPLADVRLERPLIELFTRWRAAAFDNPDALALAQGAAVALGRLGGPKAGAALEAALGDEALPELVSAVATGLGELGAACPRTAIPDLEELAKSDQQMIAMSAKRAVARCSK